MAVGFMDKVSTGFSTLNHYEKRVSGIINDPLSLLSNPSVFGSFGTGMLAKALARPDPLTSFDWEVQLPPLILDKTYTLDPEYIETCSIVIPSFAPRYVFIEGTAVPYPEVTRSIQNVTMQVYADVNNTSFGYFNAWKNLINPYPGLFGTPKPSKQLKGISGYKNDIRLIAKSPYNQDIFIITYIGCWLTSFDATSSFNSSGDRISYTVEFAVSDVKINGCNLDTITGTIQNAISGTIKKIAKAGVDAVLDAGKAVAKPLMGQAKTAFNNWVGNSVDDAGSGEGS